MDWQEVAAIVAGIGLLLLIAGTIWKGGGQLAKTDAKVEANTIAMVAMSAKADILREEFAEYKVKAAKEFVSFEFVHEMRREIQTGFRDLAGRLDNILLPRKGD